MNITREKLVTDYLDYVNNYLTIELYAEHRGLRVSEAELLLILGKQCFERPHPES
jgi:hypothetical protein